MRSRLHIIALFLMLLWPYITMAAGTPAGTPIVNTAEVSALLNGNPVNGTSNPATFTVDEVIDLNLIWQDSSNISVQPGALDQMLTYLLTNTGNGTEAFTLLVDNNITGNLFDPQNYEIFLDNNGNGGFDPGTDLPYNPATNIPTLDADEDIVLFVFNDIPADANDGETGASQLTATAETGTGSPGDHFPPATPGDPDSIIGPSGGQADAAGTYEVTAATVTLTKSVQIDDPDGGNEPVSGATLIYSILVNVSGAGTASSLVVSDPIPANTTYVANSMTLFDGATTKTLTDAVDGDEGAYTENPLGSGIFEVNYQLGNLTNTTRTVTFQVTID
jgi:uncharacterized repeat protein (TIGR01451 family)